MTSLTTIKNIVVIIAAILYNLLLINMSVDTISAASSIKDIIDNVLIALTLITTVNFITYMTYKD